MKWFILSFMGVLLLSCQGKTSSGTCLLYTSDAADEL